MHRVLFVCMGNICRSPAAEGVFRHLIAERGVEERFEVDSCGTLGYHTGEKPDKRMRSVARGRGYALESRARKFDPGDFDRFDHIVAMDEDNLREIRRGARGESDEEKISLLSDHLPGEEGRPVPDPYYGGMEGFERCLDMIERGCTHLLDELLDGKRAS